MTKRRCPRCQSTHPHLHPAGQFEGEVELCTDDFHLTPTKQNPQSYIDAVMAKRAAERHARAAALARRLCQMFDAGGESQRTVRARHASAVFQLLACDSPEQREEYRKCDADPVEYLQATERMLGDIS